MIGPKAYIHSDRLKQNIWNIRRQIGNRMLMVVVKADGYGHGALNIASVLAGEPGIIFCVFTIAEAKELREGGISNKILIFSNMYLKQMVISLILLEFIFFLDQQSYNFRFISPYCYPKELC